MLLRLKSISTGVLYIPVQSGTVQVEYCPIPQRWPGCPVYSAMYSTKVVPEPQRALVLANCWSTFSAAQFSGDGSQDGSLHGRRVGKVTMMDEAKEDEADIVVDVASREGTDDEKPL